VQQKCQQNKLLWLRTPSCNVWEECEGKRRGEERECEWCRAWCHVHAALYFHDEEWASLHEALVYILPFNVLTWWLDESLIPLRIHTVALKAQEWPLSLLHLKLLQWELLLRPKVSGLRTLGQHSMFSTYVTKSMNKVSDMLFLRSKV
jgi:hypothetical protein